MNSQSGIVQTGLHGWKIALRWNVGGMNLESEKIDMGTKNNPGAFDCYAKAAPDEPLFTLLARDSLAPHLTQIWAMIRAGNRAEASRTFNELLLSPMAAVYVLRPDTEKALEAANCALAMMQWQEQTKQG